MLGCGVRALAAAEAGIGRGRPPRRRTGRPRPLTREPRGRARGMGAVPPAAGQVHWCRDRRAEGLARCTDSALRQGDHAVEQRLRRCCAMSGALKVAAGRAWCTSRSIETSLLATSRSGSHDLAGHVVALAIDQHVDEPVVPARVSRRRRCSSWTWRVSTRCPEPQLIQVPGREVEGRSGSALRGRGPWWRKPRCGIAQVRLRRGCSRCRPCLCRWWWSTSAAWLGGRSGPCQPP